MFVCVMLVTHVNSKHGVEGQQEAHIEVYELQSLVQGREGIVPVYEEESPQPLGEERREEEEEERGEEDRGEERKREERGQDRRREER